MIEPNEEDSPHSRRSRRRLPIHGVLVAIDAPEVSEEHWVVDGLDINSDGLGLVLPADLPENTPVELTFKLLDDTVFSRLPAVIRHQIGTSGGVKFSLWPAPERLKLLEYLVEYYEQADG